MTVQSGGQLDQQQSQEQSVDRRQPHAERREQTNLSRRYGAIGIASVAAALRYTDRDSAYAPEAWRIDARFIEAAA